MPQTDPWLRHAVAATLLPCAVKAAPLPQPDHVVMVIEENKAFSQVMGNPSAPYIQSLAAAGAVFTDSHGLSHPRQPNYLQLFSGSMTRRSTTTTSFEPSRTSTRCTTRERARRLPPSPPPPSRTFPNPRRGCSAWASSRRWWPGCGDTEPNLPPEGSDAGPRHVRTVDGPRRPLTEDVTAGGISRAAPERLTGRHAPPGSTQHHRRLTSGTDLLAIIQQREKPLIRLCPGVTK